MLPSAHKCTVPTSQFQYKGIRFGKFTNPELLQRTENHKFRSTDIIVATYPKCGTTVTQEIVWHIRNKDKVQKDVQYGDLFSRFPYIELNPKILRPDIPFGIDLVENDPRERRLIKTHCPLRFFNTDDGGNTLYDPKKSSANPKVIVVTRNPFDTAVSFYHFHNSNPAIDWQGSWEEFFEMFAQNMAMYSSFTEWILEYWRIIKSGNSENLLLIKYEDIVMNMEGEVKKIAEFLGEDLTEEQLEIIAHNCTFKSMSKEGKNNAVGVFANVLFRKGEIGDYKNYFTPEQFARIEEDFVNVLKAEGLEFQY